MNTYHLANQRLLHTYPTRYANPGDVTVGHYANAGQCTSPLLFRFFHLWDSWSAVVGGSSQKPLLPSTTSQRFHWRVSHKFENKISTSKQLFSKLISVLIIIQFNSFYNIIIVIIFLLPYSQIIVSFLVQSVWLQRVINLWYIMNVNIFIAHIWKLDRLEGVEDVSMAKFHRLGHIQSV